MSRIFLPRIRDVLKERHRNIDYNTSLSFKIQEQIDEIESATKKLREEASLQYKIALDQSTNQANLRRDLDLQNLKSNISQMIKKSKDEIIEFRKNSQNDCQNVIKQLVDEISNKLIYEQI